jgi:glycosyltransferase involved in cell wall biosynthesis
VERPNSYSHRSATASPDRDNEPTPIPTVQHTPLREVLIAIPAFNEARFIGSVVLRARALGCQVLVIDDGSSDDTAEIASRAGAIVEQHETNMGKSQALNSAFILARQRGSKVLVVLDGDGQHEVGALPRVVRPILEGQADIVIGSRFLHNSDGSTPGVRRAGQRWITAITNLSSGVPVTDSQSGFRAFSEAAIEGLLLHTQGFGAEVEMQFRARELGLRVTEVPIRAIYTDPPKRNVVGQGLEVLNRVTALTGRHRPLLSFSLLAIVLGLLGLLLQFSAGAAVFADHQLSDFVSRTALLLGFGALAAFFAGAMLHAVRGTYLELERRVAAGNDGPRRRRTDVAVATADRRRHSA